MTTKTDAAMLTSLRAAYKPAAAGVLSKQEIDLIRAELQIPDRSDIELQNVRDMTVMLWGRFTEAVNGNLTAVMATQDQMSGICAVIDMEKSKRGMPV